MPHLESTERISCGVVLRRLVLKEKLVEDVADVLVVEALEDDAGVADARVDPDDDVQRRMNAGSNGFSCTQRSKSG
jgi:hypothetical protein